MQAAGVNSAFAPNISYSFYFFCISWVPRHGSSKLTSFQLFIKGKSPRPSQHLNMSGMSYTLSTTSNRVPITIQPASNTVSEFHLQSFPGPLTSGTNCLRLGSLEAEYLSKDEHSYSSDLLRRCFSVKVKEGKQNRAGIKLPRDRGSLS